MTSAQVNKVFISGSTSGLGKAIAEGFLEAGKTVYLHGRTAKNIEELLSRPNCHFFRCDLLDRSKATQIANYIMRENIDCYVNNAGIYSDLGISISSRLSLDILTTNLTAPVLIMTRLYAHYKSLRRGTIVCINSLAGITPNFNELIYCASKHGLRGFIKSLQIDAAHSNVRVLDYYPGAIQTRITRTRPGFDEFIKPEDVADLVVSDVTSSKSFVPVCQELRRTPTYRT
jgi:short-subunit dehydrogenase